MFYSTQWREFTVRSNFVVVLQWFQKKKKKWICNYGSIPSWWVNGSNPNRCALYTPRNFELARRRDDEQLTSGKGRINGSQPNIFTFTQNTALRKYVNDGSHLEIHQTTITPHDFGNVWKQKTGRRKILKKKRKHSNWEKERKKGVYPILSNEVKPSNSLLLLLILKKRKIKVHCSSVRYVYSIDAGTERVYSSMLHLLCSSGFKQCVKKTHEPRG
jgi:hypothetical protein